MPSYGSLDTHKHHLIQENEKEPLTLVLVVVASEYAILIEYVDHFKPREWFRKNDAFYELVETFSEDTLDNYLSSVQSRNNVTDAINWPESDDDNDFPAELWDEEEGDVDYPQKN